MAGLPCDVCQEDTVVLSHGEIGVDADDRLLYRRFRTCNNPNCSKYRLRRATVEVFIEAPERKVTPAEIRAFLPPDPCVDSSTPLFEDWSNHDPNRNPT